MKKFLLLSLTGLAPCAFAQKSFFGANAGVNIANQRTVSTLISNGVTILNGVGFQFNKVQPTFGFFYHLQLSETAGIRLNAQYMGLGYKTKTDSAASININYLTFPLTFHYKVTNHLSFNSGAYLSFTLGGTKINNQDITKTYHKNDFGVSLGGEYELGKSLAVSMSYIIGLKNIWLDDSSTIPNVGLTVNSKHTNRALQITFIHKFKKPI